jgi:hypothetical protein
MVSQRETLRECLKLFGHTSKISVEIDYMDLCGSLPCANLSLLFYYMASGRLGWGLVPKLAPTSESDVSAIISDLRDEGYHIPDFDLSLRAEYLMKNPDGLRDDIAFSKVVTKVEFRRPGKGGCEEGTSDGVKLLVDQQHANELHRGVWAAMQWSTDYDVQERDRKYFEAFPHMRDLLQ